MSDVVLCEVDAGVATLTLNRPERLNAWTAEMERSYFDLLEQCGGSSEVRAIVVTGAGRGFCAGADMSDLQSLGRGDFEASEEDPGDPPRVRPQSYPLSIPKPIIAAINGPCAGIGLVQALMCDVRYAAQEAKLTTAFARRGLIAEHGISWVLPRLIGPARALDLLLSARVVLGSEAADIGLVNHALPQERVLDAALAYARDLATNCSPASLGAVKAQVYEALERDLEPSLETANALMLESFSRPDFSEGVASFVERRAPRFAPLSTPSRSTGG